MHPIDAAVSLAREHGLEPGDPVVMKDGSNLIVHLVPLPIVVRVATLTAWVRADPRPYLEREVALTRTLAAAGASVAPESPFLAPGPYEQAGWWMTVAGWVEHRTGVVPTARDTLAALDDLHAALATIDVELPVLGPVTGDLDRAWRRIEDGGFLGRAALDERRSARDDLVATLLAASPSLQPLHGDAYPRNALVASDGRVVWIDFEDSCAGPPAWDHAVLILQGGDPGIEPELRARDGDAALDAALALRALQIEAWTILHDARAAGRLPVPQSWRRPAAD